MNIKDRLPNLAEATEGLRRLQTFDTKTLPRRDELGTVLNFEGAVEPADMLIDLYRQLPIESLPNLPNDKLGQLLQSCRSDFKALDDILKFQPGRPQPERDALVQVLWDAYSNTWNVLHPFISFSVRKTTDFSRLEREARATAQGMQDRASAIEKDLAQRSVDAQQILETIRKVAAEQGVSQQAIFFRNEADAHEKSAEVWLTRSTWFGVGVGVFAVVSLFLHNLPLLVPSSGYDTLQLAISKALIFATISYGVFVSTRNYFAHRHNAVVNRHRQHALATYEAIVKAAGDQANRDIVLTKAADCIFSPQGSAFSKGDTPEGGHLSLVNMASGAIKPTASA